MEKAYVKIVTGGTDDGRVTIPMNGDITTAEASLEYCGLQDLKSATSPEIVDGGVSVRLGGDGEYRYYDIKGDDHGEAFAHVLEKEQCEDYYIIAMACSDRDYSSLMVIMPKEWRAIKAKWGYIPKVYVLWHYDMDRKEFK